MKVTVLFSRKDPVNDDVVILDETIELDTEYPYDGAALGWKIQSALVRIQCNWVMDEYGQLTEKSLSDASRNDVSNSG